MIKNSLLTKEIAKKFLKNKYSVDLETFTDIEDAAAEILAGHKGGLSLSALKNLSETAASFLALVEPIKNDYNSLELGYALSSPAVARRLATYKGDQLSFRLTSIDLDLIKALAEFRGQLWLGDVTHLSDEVAAELAKREGGADLDGLQEYNNSPGHISLARALIKWNKSRCLDLKGARISPEVLAIFAEYEGPEILLTSIDLDQVKALAEFRGKLWLGDVTHLTDEVAAELAKREGGADLNGLQEYNNSPGHISLARALIKWNKSRCLDLKGARISPEVLAIFAEYEGPEILAESSIMKKLLMTRKKLAAKIIKTGKLSTPDEWKNERIVLPRPPAKRLKGINAERTRSRKASWWLSNSVCDWFQQKLDDAHSIQIYKYGVYISPEAAELLRSKSLEWMWLMEREMSPAKKQERQQMDKAAGSAGFSQQDLKAKLDRLSKLAKENLALACDMIAGFDSEWLFEALLAGAEVEKGGKLSPGIGLKPFKQHIETIMLVSIAHLPDGATVDASLNRHVEMEIDVNEANLELLMGLASRFPSLRPRNCFCHHLQILSPEVATFLSRCKGELDLNGLTILNDSVASTISQQTGKLKLIGLSNLDAAAAEALSRHQGGLDLSGLRSLSVTIAQALARHEGELDLNGLVSLSNMAAKALGQHKGKLRLRGLQQLEVTVAEALAQHRGELDLSGLNSLSDMVAKALAKHKGTLRLGCFWMSLESLSDVSAEALGRHEGHLAITSIQKLSPYGASQLVNLPSLELIRSRFGTAVQKIFNAAGTWRNSTWTRNS